MILLVTPENRESYLELLDEQYLLRNKIFNGRLGWELPTFSEREIDQYDRSDTVYLLGYSKDKGVYSGCRLLPSLSPYMLEKTFPQVQVKHYPKTKRVWESSRFFVDTDAFKDQGPLGIKMATYELMLGMQEFGFSRGLDSIFTLTDIRIERIFRMVGCPLKRASPSIELGNTMSIACYVKINSQYYENIKSKTNFEDPVLIEC